LGHVRQARDLSPDDDSPAQVGELLHGVRKILHGFQGVRHELEAFPSKMINLGL
jgi:hypothetical protein